MKWLENTIAAISPAWGAQRAANLLRLEIARRAYEGAAGGRRQNSWSRPSTSANAEIGAAGTKLRQSARDLVRNHPNAKKAKRSYVSHMVGTGIIPRAATKSAARNKKINQAFDDWCEACDADGLLNFYGLQGLAAGAMFESGDALARYYDVPLAEKLDGSPIPFEVQILEIDYLDTSRSGAIGTDGAYINRGIEFNKRNRRIAYHLWDQHPGDHILGISRSLTSRRVPASMIAHVFRIDRPGQMAGVSELAAAMQNAYDLKEHDEVELLRRKIASCLGIVVKQREGGSPPIGVASTEADGRRIEELAPGMIQYLRTDEEIQQITPPAAEGYAEFTDAQLHAIAAGWGVTFEELTGNWKGVNYSSFRAGQLGYRRSVEMDQWNMVIPMLCRPTWRRFIDRLVLVGIIDRPDYAVRWETPRFESVDPEKDARADMLEVRAGFQSLPKVISRRGDNPVEVLEEIAEINKKIDELGLVLDSDPRRTSSSGQNQAGKPADAGDKPKDEEGNDANAKE